ncbi:MAG: MFS transporter [Bacteriovoracaceae bacterium]
MSKMTIVSNRDHIRSSFRDAIFTNLNIGMNETYFCAFMLALGVSGVVAGFSTILVQFIGVVFQLFSISRYFRRYSLKNRLLIFLTTQILSLIPLIIIGIYRINSPSLLILILGLYWASLLSLNPPWNKLIGHTVPAKFRLNFFSLRSQYSQFSIFVGLLFSGLLLKEVKGSPGELEIFVYLFIIGVCLKIFSWLEVKYRHNDAGLLNTESILPFREFLKRLRSTDQGKLISFLFLFYISVTISSPYFSPYMLEVMKLDYLKYMTVISVSLMGRVLMFKFLQKKSKSRHLNKILIFSTIGIASSPLLWSFSQNFWYILIVEIVSGCYWAGFELSTILLLYQKIEDHERTSVMSYLAFFNIMGMTIGSGIGALMLHFFPSPIIQFETLFIISSIARLIIALSAPHVNFKGKIPKIIYAARPFGIVTRPFIEKITRRK